MSYSFQVAAVKAADFPAAADAAAKAYRASLAANDYTLDEYAERGVLVALGTAKALVTSGVAGAGLVSAQIGGHANPGQKPVKGWSNDFLTVTVSCADPVPTA